MTVVSYSPLEMTLVAGTLVTLFPHTSYHFSLATISLNNNPIRGGKMPKKMFNTVTCIAANKLIVLSSGASWQNLSLADPAFGLDCIFI